jgi:hypothetical protein
MITTMFPADKVVELFSHAHKMSTTALPVLNRAEDLEAFDRNILDTTPHMCGSAPGSRALHEIHLFMLPIWTTDFNMNNDHITKYREVIKMFNATMGADDSNPYFKIMKDPILALNFVDTGYVTVMQSSLYVLSNDRMEVIKACHQLATMFSLAGLQVVREKIEASAYGIVGVPQTDEEADKYGKYFEFHIRVTRKDASLMSDLTPEELTSLEKTSEFLTSHFGVPVPLSYNRSKTDVAGGQRYLNIRVRNKGMTTIRPILKYINQYIDENTPFKVQKTISEFVWYDSFETMDDGWINPKGLAYGLPDVDSSLLD